MNCRLKNTFALIIAGILIFASSCNSQKFVHPSKQKTFRITVNIEDKIIKTQLLAESKTITIHDDLSYLWYSSQKIIETKGGFSGKLIHGAYTVYFLNEQLREKGNIKYGLREGVWKYWYPDGSLREIIAWKNGVKSGKYQIFNDEGKRMAKGRFKGNRLHGKFITYTNGERVAEIRRYRRGNEISPFWKKLRHKKTDENQRSKKDYKNKKIKSEKKSSRNFLQKIKKVLKSKEKEELVTSCYKAWKRNKIDSKYS